MRSRSRTETFFSGPALFPSASGLSTVAQRPALVSSGTSRVEPHLIRFQWPRPPPRLDPRPWCFQGHLPRPASCDCHPLVTAPYAATPPSTPVSWPPPFVAHRDSSRPLNDAAPPLTEITASGPPRQGN